MVVRRLDERSTEDPVNLCIEGEGGGGSAGGRMLEALSQVRLSNYIKLIK